MDKLDQALREWAGRTSPGAETVARLQAEVARSLEGLPEVSRGDPAAGDPDFRRKGNPAWAAAAVLLVSLGVAMWFWPGGRGQAGGHAVATAAMDVEENGGDRPYLTHSLTDAEVQALIQKAVSPHERPLRIEYELIKRARREIRWENKAAVRHLRSDGTQQADAPSTNGPAWPRFRPLVIDVPPAKPPVKDDGSSFPHREQDLPRI